MNYPEYDRSTLVAFGGSTSVCRHPESCLFDQPLDLRRGNLVGIEPNFNFPARMRGFNSGDALVLLQDRLQPDGAGDATESLHAPADARILCNFLFRRAQFEQRHSCAASGECLDERASTLISFLLHRSYIESLCKSGA